LKLFYKQIIIAKYKEILMKKLLQKSAFLTFIFFAISLFSADYSIRGYTDKEVAIYKPGEKMEFTLRVYDGETVVTGKTLKWTRTGDDGKTEKGEGIATEEGLKITTSMDKPGFVRILAYAFGEDGKNLQGYVGGWGANKTGNIFFDGGACVEPEKLQPVSEPEDFDEFWKQAIEDLNKVPLKAELKEIQSKTPEVKIYAVKVDCAGPKPVTGYLSIPSNAKPKSLPAIATFHGYGVNKHNPPGNPNKAAIVFDVNAHGMELGKEDEYYTNLKNELKNYCFNNEENKNPKTSYFYGMALRVIRSLQYLKSLPEWNGKDLQSNGGSQGGLQGLWGAGLDKDVTASNIWSPWCCDLGGITLGRLRGWRPDYQRALDYFDPVFHVKRTNAKIHLIANYGDYTCPPSSVWIVYNNIPHKNKSMEVKQGCTHGYQMKAHMKYVISPEGITNIGLANR